MKQSHLFTKTRKDAPKDEVSRNAELLIRGGYIHKEVAGVYSFLPLGLRVLNKISNIVREEMNALGAQEGLVSVLQDPEIWKKTDRWSEDNVDAWLKTELSNGTALGLSFSHEEPWTRIMTNHVHSYRDLPLYTYHIQSKFRNELRAKGGIMRGREFLMKDLYSFSRTEEDLNQFYTDIGVAYENVYRRVGIGDSTYLTFATGGVFSKWSHEFQTVSDVGEDTIYIDMEKKIAVNKEVFTDEVLQELSLDRNVLVEKKSIEVGNIFKLGTRYSVPLGLSFKDEDGVEKPVVMGSYGIGITRLMGTVVEVLSDAKGIVWPESIAPFKIHLIELSQGNAEVRAFADSLYMDLLKAGVEVLYDERDVRAGEKFADSELLGIPYRVVIGKSATPDAVEITRRTDGKVNMITTDALLTGEYGF
ncbi:MAG: aminoacyl--tRNA ligase-related protein [Patescibacteria group bacterium]